MARVAIIADDLTGALDTASPFACGGLRVHGALDPSALEEAMAGDPDVVAVSTGSRDLPGHRAADLATSVARRLRTWHPDLVLKKVDSRLKGNVASETAAVADAFGMSRIVAAPAVPDQGRVVRNGQIEGAGLDAPIDVVERLPLGKFLVSVRDAESDAELDRIATDWSAGDGALYVCARGLAAAFARRLAVTGMPGPFVARSPVIIAVGSRDPITERQVGWVLAEREEAAIVEAPGGQLPAGWVSGPLTIFVCTGRMVEPAASVAGTFGRAVAAEAARLRPSTMLLTGGDTALAVLQALGAKTLEIGGEAAAGLPWFNVAAGGASMTVITKSGGFGSEDILSRVVGKPESGAEFGCSHLRRSDIANTETIEVAGGSMHGPES